MAKVNILLLSIILINTKDTALIKNKVVKDWIYIGYIKTNNIIYNIL